MLWSAERRNGCGIVMWLRLSRPQAGASSEGGSHAGRVTAVLGDVMDDWRHDIAEGKDALSVAGDWDTVKTLNRAAQKLRERHRR